jgi:hypothetical protein
MYLLCSFISPHSLVLIFSHLRRGRALITLLCVSFVFFRFEPKLHSTRPQNQEKSFNFLSSFKVLSQLLSSSSSSSFSFYFFPIIMFSLRKVLTSASAICRAAAVRSVVSRATAARFVPALTAKRWKSSSAADAAVDAAAADTTTHDDAHHAPVYAHGSKYPVPPVGASPGVVFIDDSMDPRKNPDLPYSLDRSTGVNVIRFHEGPYKGEEVVIAHAVSSLEWVIPTPPPLHCFDETPIVKEPAEESD